MKTATHALSAQNVPTASLILPLKTSIIQQLDGIAEEENAEDDDHHPSIHEVKMTIKHDLMTRWVGYLYWAYI